MPRRPKIEFRVYVFVEGLTVDDEASWEPFIEYLEDQYGERGRGRGGYGPVVGWTDGIANVVGSVRAATEAEAAMLFSGAVCDALHATGIGDRYPNRIEVERA